MKVLFVCYANIGRSQVAQEYYNHLTDGNSLSVGCSVDYLGIKKISDAPYKRSIKFIQDVIGVDISEKETVQLTEELIDSSDLVIAILERDQFPPWLIENNKVRWWDIQDTPDKGIEATYNIWFQVMQKVEELVQEFHVIINENGV